MKSSRRSLPAHFSSTLLTGQFNRHLSATMTFHILVLVLLQVGQIFAQQQTQATPYGYHIHNFDGNCYPDGTCKYTLTIPVVDAVNLNGDNQTSQAVINHLYAHDKQLEQLLGFFGGQNGTQNSINVLEELTLLRNQEKTLSSLVNILTDDVNRLLTENHQLTSQLKAVNQTILNRLSDPCLARPCEHGAKCTPISESVYHCDCPMGWNGTDCEIDINECKEDPYNVCSGNGYCQNDPGSFFCECYPGWTGKNCSTNIDECASTPCLNGGTCQDMVGYFLCDCDHGFAGYQCQYNINECDSDPCLNGAICLDDVRDFYCVCSPGWKGKDCSEDYDECETNPCVHGKCVNDNGTFHCECDSPLITGRLCDEAPYRDCADLKRFWNFNRDAVYTMKMPNKLLTLGNCDMTTDGGGWTIFQRRVDNVVNFNRNWDDYKEGFGNLGTSYWWGTERLYNVTQGRQNLVLRIDMMDWDNNTAYAEYDGFSIGNETESFKLNVNKYRGTAGDALNFYWKVFSHNGMKFSTKDRDNDNFRTNCAQVYHGGFWYNACWSCNINGVYYNTPYYNSSIHDGIEYYPWKKTKYSLKMIELKFRASDVIASNNTTPFA